MLRLLLTLLLSLSLPACERRKVPESGTSAEVATDLGNGMYLATGIFDTLAAAETSSRGSRIVTDHHIYEPPSERAAPRFVTIDTTEHVPFILEAAPTTTDDSSGRTLLSITLDAKYKEKLKEFTTRYLGKSVAILVGGELVSVHKIRSVISEGKLQVTSCGADVCKVLYSKLVGAK
jgi:preprotein translocase subunit SecD